jgi:uncharacterized protein
MYGTNIVIDVNSGAVHIFDDVAYDVLDLYKKCPDYQIADKLSSKYKEREVLEAVEEIRGLEESGQLYSEDEYKEYLPLWDRKSVVKALCIHISHDCNLRCRYCFAATGNFGGNRTMMSPETGKKAIDFLVKESGSRRNLEIDFFGGEPLMNFGTVKEIVDYAVGIQDKYNKNFRFTITTNALLLDEEIKNYINENMQNVVLSIDGRESTNDRMRFRIDGKGTYKAILDKIKDMAESRNQDNYYVRGTFTRENLDFSKDVLLLADEGFKQISVKACCCVLRIRAMKYREEDLAVAF